MRCLIALALILSASPAMAFHGMGPGPGITAGGGGGGTCVTPADGDLLSEGFIGTDNSGYELTGWTATTGTATIDPNYALPGTPPSGSCSEGLRITASGGQTPTYATHGITSTGLGAIAMDVDFDLYVASYSSTTTYRSVDIITVNDRAGLDQFAFRARVLHNGTSLVLSVQGANSQETPITTGTWYHVRIHLDTTAANSYVQINGGTQATFTRDYINTVDRVHIGANQVGDSYLTATDISMGAIWVNTP